MKAVSKLSYIFGGLVLWGAFVVGVVNIVQWAAMSIKTIIDEAENKYEPHRVYLRHLYLWTWEDFSNYAWLSAWENNLNILNGIIVWEWESVDNNSLLVAIWWWSDNTIKSSFAWIAGWQSNEIQTSSLYSVIGWWSSNTVNGKNGVIAWWEWNKVDSEWGVIVWWENNTVNGEYWVVAWGLHNSAWKDGLVFGQHSSGGERAFSWNDRDMWEEELNIKSNSAYVWASSWFLIWTYESKSGVNLVVNGAVRIWWEKNKWWTEWEIRVIDGCFYGYYDGKWSILWESSEVSQNCNELNVAATCEFWNTRLWEWDIVDGYSKPYANNCISIAVQCNSEGKIVPANGSEASEKYYPYCYNLGEEW